MEPCSSAAPTRLPHPAPADHDDSPPSGGPVAVSMARIKGDGLGDVEPIERLAGSSGEQVEPEGTCAQVAFANLETEEIHAFPD